MGRKRKYSYETIKQIIEEKGFILLTKEEDYINVNMKLKYICPKHGEKSSRLDHFRNGFVCDECGHEKTKLSFDFIKEQFEKRGYILLEDKYLGSGVKMKYICPKHSDKIQEICYDNLKQGKGCKYCGIEETAKSRRLKFEYVKNKFEEKDLVLLEDKYINNSTKMKFICKKHPNIIQEKSYNKIQTYKNACTFCHLEENENNNDFDFYSLKLANYLRFQIKKWRSDSLEYYNNKCSLTGLNKGNLVVHHLYFPFAKIMYKALKILKLPLYDEINKYTKNDLKLIKNKCLELHYKYGYGVPLINELHKLFHSLYGVKNNNLQQFEEFIQKYYNEEFDDLLTPENRCFFITNK